MKLAIFQVRNKITFWIFFRFFNYLFMLQQFYTLDYFSGFMLSAFAKNVYVMYVSFGVMIGKYIFVFNLP